MYHCHVYCLIRISAVSVFQGFNLIFAKCTELQTDMKEAPHSRSEPYHLLKTICFFNNKRNLLNSLLKIGQQKNQEMLYFMSF